MAPLPVIDPMKAVAGPLPPDEEAWAYEVKWDGMRIVAAVGADEVVLRTARRRDVAQGYPELVGLAGALGGHRVVLDGELVAVDDEGRPSFGRLAGRLGVTDPSVAAARAAAAPVVYVVFDLLHVDGTDVWRLPYLDRREALSGLVPAGPHWTVPAHRIGGGSELLAEVAARGMEGIVAKRPDRPYEPGRRSPSWRKVKVRRRQEFVVGGWTPGRGNRGGRPGALMLGCHRAGRLRWVGNVGTGFTDADLDRWAGIVATLEEPGCPFDPPPSGPASRGARWVRPERVVEVAFAEWTADHRLRHPAVLGERVDKDAAEVTCDP